jgi:hypothetical protein
MWVRSWKPEKAAYLAKGVFMQTLGKVVEVADGNIGIGLAEAKNLAKEAARQACKDPMLLSWYDAGAGTGHPDLECGRGDKPAWVVYAESRGGNLTVVVNDGDYIFYYLALP